MRFNQPGYGDRWDVACHDPISAAIGVGGSVIGSIFSGGAASDAADKQAGAAREAAARSEAQVAQARADLAPYRDAGSTGLDALMASLGLGGNGINLLQRQTGSNNLVFNPVGGTIFNPTQATLEATPGYQFTRDQGLQATANSNAAQGRGISGAALKGAAQFATGLADNTLKTQQQIFQDNLENQRKVFQGNLGNVLNPLSSLATSGQKAATDTSQIGLQGTQNANQYTVGAGNAEAAGIIGQGNAISSAFNQVGQAPLNYALYNKLLGSGNGNGSGGSGGVYSGTWD